MIAEDDPDLRALLATALGEFRVVCFDSGTSLVGGLERASRDQQCPALVVSDERMPGMTGLRALQRVRALGWSIPCVLITSFGDDALALKAQAAGVTLLRKPFGLDELRTLVRTLLGCATCGGTQDLRAESDGNVAFSCGQCRSLRDTHEVARATLEFGGAD